MTEFIIGVDISKTHLDVHRLDSGEHARFGNDKAGFWAFADWIGGRLPDLVVFEPTGLYHGRFERHFATHLPLAKVNPLQARRFAQACGVRAKTDAVPSRRCKHRLPGSGCTDACNDGQRAGLCPRQSSG